MLVRQAQLSDLGAIVAILDDNKLPSEDCLDHIDHFIILEIDGKISGIGGLEYHASYALLRSIVIKAENRNRGLGKTIICTIADLARDNEVKTLYLLTEDASDYFATSGFTRVDRSEVPLPIRQTRQFSSLCPASVTVMAMDISP